ncbi:MAG: RecX family transcriptional regulator [Tannerellaceae bacterium]|jgi:regulatory protein|nr:RecX family transcriptional regulator [Tannerellaceae bacterium]
MKEITEAEMLHKAAAYCSAAERCRQDVEKKIVAAGLSREAADRILDRMERERFIDEARFCRSFVNDKLRYNKWGRVRLKYELRMRNIPEDTISDALDAIDETLYLDTLRTVIKEKRRTIKGSDSRDVFGKLLRFAAGRGFENELVVKCLREYGDDEEMDRESDY